MAIFFWEIIQWTEFGIKIHPMIQASKNQKLIHHSKTEIFNNYRKKKILLYLEFLTPVFLAEGNPLLLLSIIFILRLSLY